MNLWFAENRSHLFAISYFEIYSSFLSMFKKSAERWDIYGCCKRFAKSFENSHHFVQSSSRNIISSYFIFAGISRAFPRQANNNLSRRKFFMRISYGMARGWTRPWKNRKKSREKGVRTEPRGKRRRGLRRLERGRRKGRNCLERVRRR